MAYKTAQSYPSILSDRPWPTFNNQDTFIVTRSSLWFYFYLCLIVSNLNNLQNRITATLEEITLKQCKDVPFSFSVMVFAVAKIGNILKSPCNNIKLHYCPCITFGIKFNITTISFYSHFFNNKLILQYMHKYTHP